MEPVFVGDSNSRYFMNDLSHYNKDIERVMDLEEWKSKVQKYCQTDCIALYQILTKFKKLVYDKWKVNI